MNGHVASTDLDRVEDLAADALAADRRAAQGLRSLPLSAGRRASNVAWLCALLTSDRLFEEPALEALDDLESELHRCAEAEAIYLHRPFDEHDVTWLDHPPVRHLSEAGLRIKRARDEVADAIRHARRVRDLLAAERLVGRQRRLAV
jgi:hypothetical protein